MGGQPTTRACLLKKFKGSGRCGDAATDRRGGDAVTAPNRGYAIGEEGETSCAPDAKGKRGTLEALGTIVSRTGETSKRKRGPAARSRAAQSKG